MRMVDLIEKKRDGKELAAKEINFIIEGYTREEIPDYQVSAFMMAVFFQGMTDKELLDLTMAMVNSGDTVDLSSIEGVKVDKHSTGGVGDTTTLALAPMVAALGIPVAKMSGRGLGHTGGTIDKLESIAGFRAELNKEEFIKLVNKTKLAVTGQSGNLTPADKKLYALRDVTATVNSIPLIASSIMSKKIAAGSDAIVLDVKTGAGAFMKKAEEAKKLAQAMVNIGNNAGRKTIAVISDMSQPLGFAVGNALEVKEAIDTLQGNGPKDLEELCFVLGSQMVYLAKKAPSVEVAREMLKEVCRNGKALAKFKEFLTNQGGDASVVERPEKLPHAAYQVELLAKETGVVSEIVADAIGRTAMILGAGRFAKDDKIDLAVGLVLHKKIGDKVSVGESLITIHANRRNIEDVIAKVYENIRIASIATTPMLVHEIIN